MSAKREGMARSWEVATRELPNFWERTQGKSWAEKVGQNKKLGREGEYGVLPGRARRGKRVKPDPRRGEATFAARGHDHPTLEARESGRRSTPAAE